MKERNDHVIEFREALAKVLDHTPVLPEECRPIGEALGYTLARDIRTEEPVPPFDSSAMDGFGVRMDDVQGASEDHPVTLHVQAEVRPGLSSLPSLEKGKSFRIFTGSPVPPDVEAIVIKEHTKDTGDKVAILGVPERGEHIRPKGGEFKKGAQIFSAGTLLTPPVVGMLASLGIVEATVFKKPGVAIITTGDEVRPPTGPLEPGQIRDANSFSLAAALQAMGITPVLTLHARDDEEEITSAFRTALEVAHVIISVGGVSVGTYDFVKSALERLEVETIFWRVAMKPGKPNYFGKKGQCLLFGLPGNTVSSLVSFQMLVRPALKKLQGRAEEKSPVLMACLDGELKKNDNRLEFVRGRLVYQDHDKLLVQPMKGRGSHMLGNLALADCLIHFPRDKSHLEKGDLVKVEPLSWSEFLARVQEK